MTRKPKWQEQVEEKIGRALDPDTASSGPSEIEDRAPDFLWSGRPVYRCRVCGDRYERVENLASVLKHEAEAHGGTIRPSPILGADGQPMLIEEE